MPTFTKLPGASVTGTAGSDLILVNAGADADTGTINVGFGLDTLRFASSVEGDLLFIGPNITGIETVQIGGGTGLLPSVTSTALDIDASAAANALTFFGNNGSNFVIGTAFDDVFNCSAGEDQLFGGEGNDQFIIASLAAGNPASVIDGEDGADKLFVTVASGTLLLGAATYVEEIFITATGAVSVDASNVFNDAGFVINGGAGANRIVGTDLADTIRGGAGIDTLEGGGGNDVFIASQSESPVSEIIKGGDGIDEIRLAGGDLVLNAATEIERIAMGPHFGGPGASVDASAMTRGVHIQGNSAGNSIRGTAFADTLEGGGGEDRFTFFSASHHTPGEIITGGDDFDILEFISSAPATLVLGSGVNVERVDAHFSAAGVNLDGSVLSVGTQLWGNSRANSITGSAFHDTLRGGLGNDTLLGGAGNDAFEFLSAAEMTADLIDGGAGNDRLLLSHNSPSPNLMYVLPSTLAGVEAVELGGATAPVPGFGNALVVHAGNVGYGLSIAGTLPIRYSVTGTSHGDTIAGASGQDDLSGNGGDDSILGGDGADVIQGGAGADFLDGEEGEDRYDFNSPESFQGDVISDSGVGGPDDRVTFTLTSAQLLAAYGADEPIVLDLEMDGIERVDLTVAIPQALEFEFDFSGFGQAHAFQSTVQGQLGRIGIIGTGHDDRFVGGTGRHHYVGGEGNDTFSLPNANSRFEGGDGEDAVWINSSYAIPSSWSGIESVAIADPLTGVTTGTSAVNLRAGASSNALDIAGNNGANNIIGTRYDDTLTGNGGADILSGGAGNDVLEGGAGSDFLLGAGGNDRFLGFAAGDHIMGDAGEDTLEFAGSGLNLDLTLVSDAAIRGVENFDITGDGANAIKLAFGDVKYNLGVGEANALHIVTDADDTVVLAGTWTNLGTEGNTTTHSATLRGQTVFVEIEAPVAEGLTIFAVDGPDSIVGGSGNDTVVFEPGTYDFSDDFADAGGGIDTLVADGTLLNMFEGTFASFEKVELENGAQLVANNDALEITAISGSNEAELGNNADQSYVGNASDDNVVLGAPSQSVSAGDGDDEVEATNTQLVGASIDLGSDGGDLFVAGNGSASLLDAAFVSGGLSISYATDISALVLNNGGHMLFVNANADATLTSGDNSGGDDTFRFGSNLWSDRQYTINGFQQGASGDQIEVLISSFGGVYAGEADSAGVDAALPDDALRNGVFNTELSALVVDYSRDGAFGGGDLTIFLPGVTDLTAGTDVFFTL